MTRLFGLAMFDPSMQQLIHLKIKKLVDFYGAVNLLFWWLSFINSSVSKILADTKKSGSEKSVPCALSSGDLMLKSMIN